MSLPYPQTGLRATLREVSLWSRPFLRLRGPLAGDATAEVLHTLLLGLLGWVLLMFLFNLPTTPRFAASVSLHTFLLLTLGGSLTALRRGSLRTASLVYLAGTWLTFTVTIIFSGGIQSPILSCYASIAISAAWLLGPRGALGAAAVCVASSAVMMLIEVAGVHLPRYFPGRPFNVWIVLVGAMVIAAVPVARLLQVLKEALVRSQDAEARLLEHQQQLEEKVQQRTADLAAARDQAQVERDRANDANQAKTVFLANMNHELRTPLNAILGFSALVRADNALSQRHQRDLDIVRASGEHLLGLIDGVLEMAKIESGSIAVEPKSFDLHALVTNVTGMVSERAAAKDLQLELNISSGCPRYVRCDPGKLHQVLLNLAGNAVKYTDQGRVVISLSVKPGDEPQGLVMICDVADTGIGIAPADQARIFDRFVQAGPSGSSKGTGLGLSITRRLVHLLGGTVGVESIEGQGSVFHVEIPVERTEAPDVMAPAGVTLGQVVGLEPGQPDYRIQIVEDQKENWLLLQRLLGAVGFQTRTAGDGAQAIEVFEAWRPHFIWMDLHLPVMSGLEATARIRELTAGSEVKIAAVTASVFTSQRDEVLKAGFDDFIRKPYRPQEIFECMARHLGVRYRYEAQQAAGGGAPETLRAENLATLPANLRQELENAVIALDAARIALVASQISEQNAALGNVLAKMAAQLTFTPILEALESCDEVLKAAAGGR